jgi:ethylbenzene dioxygenase ferredoxin subunit
MLKQLLIGEMMGRRIDLVEVGAVIEGSPVEVNPSGLPSLVVYRIGDDFFVTDNQCTHGNAMLCDGFQEGDTIICPYHDGGFDIKTGMPIAAPCTIPLQTYQTTVESGRIYIDCAYPEILSAKVT